MSAREAMAELIAASETVARSVKMPVEGIDGGFVKLDTPLATRLINAVIDIRRATQEASE
jgi:hypothetical protein